MIGTLSGWDKYVSSPDVKYIAKNAWELAEAMEQEYLNSCNDQDGESND